ncbi:MAG: DNA adenine methylase, partial [Armatimonadota bacterium]
NNIPAIANRKNEIPIANYFRIQNRRYLGNKYKLLDFIDTIVREKCGEINSFCDIFSGTGVVSQRFNNESIKIISNDILKSNFIPLNTFFKTVNIDKNQIIEKINYLNSIESKSDNYFSDNYANKFFTLENARKIGVIRDEIDMIKSNQDEHNILLTSLIYAVDKVANTVGHYDAYRKNIDNIAPVKLLIPLIDTHYNHNNEVFNEDANLLINRIETDVLYIDPPYNSRQYCDTYHLLENLVTWKKPKVYGKAGKMERSDIKSRYCTNQAVKAFYDLIINANTKHIIVSYNNTGNNKDNRSNARISDNQIIQILQQRGTVEVFEYRYKAFSTGRSESKGHTERLFYCRVTK